VNQAPVCVPLTTCGSAGIIGSRPSALALMRSMVMDIAVHHSYDEVKIVVIFPESEFAEWDCLRWLPHVWDENRITRYMAKDKVAVRSMFAQLLEVFKQRESAIRNHIGNVSEATLPQYVFLIADQSLVLNEQLVPYIVHSRKDLGISSVFLFDRIENLPKDCGMMIHIAEADGKIINMNHSEFTDTFTADLTNTQEMDSFCRSLAPVRLKKLLDEYMLPQVVSFLEMYGVDQVEGLNIEKRWSASEPYLGLKAPIGMGTNGQIVDLLLGESARDHGVHGLVAGTTRSGKSEFLQTLILSLAVNYLPSDVAFVLVDYKGGAMANAFRGLPHLAGIITNLGGNQTERALASINSEIKRRQMLFEQAGVDTIVKYQKKFRNGQIKDPIPHLLIIVDEFAELKTEKPEFISKMVSAARVGGSLGIKLILATQKPTGVVDEQIKSNAGYSVCLKVQTAGDSKEMLDRPDASLINLPGRAYLKAGTDFVFELFQSAWSGADYTKNGKSGNEEICEVGLNGIRYRLNVDIFKPEYHESQTQLLVISDYIQKLSEIKGVQATNSIWLPPLPESITLEELEVKNSSGERLPIIGLVDDPPKQAQYPLSVNFLKDGHLAIYGGPTSGKTTLLQTLIVSIARNYSPDEFVMYILDFGTRTMNMFEGMPSVGGVAMMDEEDKIKNLFKYLTREINQRKRLFSEADVSSIQSYRESSGETIPAIVLIIDNFSSLLEIYPDTEDPLIQITRDGGNLGIFIVLTANTQSSVKYKVAGNIRAAIALQMVDKSDYVNIVGRTNGLVPAAIDGRGLFRDTPPLEFQTALPARGANELERALNIKKFIKSLNDLWKGKRADTIPLIPKRLEMNELMDTYRSSISGSGFTGSVPIGLSIEEIGPVVHDFRESRHMLIAGKSRTVSNVFLKAFVEMILMEELKENSSLYIFDSGAKSLLPLKTMVGVAGYSSKTEEAQPLFIKLNEDINEPIDARGIVSSNEPAFGKEREIFIIISDFNEFKQMLPGESGLVLESVVRREHMIHVHIVMAGQIADIGNAWDGLGKAMRDQQTGVLLSDPNEQQVFNIRLPYSETNRPLKTSEGYYINHGSAIRVKLPNL
jgi:S-DNA-T family DNA segregation ATPase FtsK/SpoIIIE